MVITSARSRLLSFIVVFGVFGAATLFIARASESPPASTSVEAESGVQESPARSITVVGRSGGRVVEFGPGVPTVSCPPSVGSGAASTLKAPLRGVTDRGGSRPYNPMPGSNGNAFTTANLPSAAYSCTVNSIVLNFRWSDLNPNETGPNRFNFSQITNALNIITAANAANPSPNIQVRLRVFSGFHAPTWLMDKGSLNMYDNWTGDKRRIGKFWTNTYRDAYNALQTELARQFDTHPLLAETVVSRCSLFYPEPLLRGVHGTARGTMVLDDDNFTPISIMEYNMRNLHLAGFTLAADKTCQDESLQAHDAWRFTRTQLAFSEYSEIADMTPGGNPITSVRGDYSDYPVTLIRKCRTLLSSRCVLGNYSIRWPTILSNIHNEIRRQGPPIAYQTAVATGPGTIGIGDWRETLNWAANTQKANSVELVARDDYDNEYPIGELGTYDTQLRDNPF